MTKTVCDICGNNNAKFHCVVPMKNIYNIKGGRPEKLLHQFSQIDLVEIDLCDIHASFLANYLETWQKLYE